MPPAAEIRRALSDVVCTVRQVVPFRGFVAAVVLTACFVGSVGCTHTGSGDEAIMQAQTTLDSIPGALGRVASLEHLRAAVAAAGLPCTVATPDIAMNASESGSCSPRDRLLVYTSEEGMRDDIRYLTTNVPGALLLVGPNWIVNSTEAKELRTALGGVVIEFAGPPVEATASQTPAPMTSPYGEWYQYDGLQVKVTAPQRYTPTTDDTICADADDRPWKASMTVRNTGKKKRDLYDVKYFARDTAGDPLIYNRGEPGAVTPGEQIFAEYIEPGQTRTFNLGICPINRDFDSSTPMELDILGATDGLAVTLGGSK